jgi:Holliday junction DNA helicase RuvA
MIAFVKGILEEKKPDKAILDINGFGLEINIPLSAYNSLPEPGSEVRLETHFQTREDSMTLYGFTRNADKELFKLLLGVSSIGSKIALAVLSAVSVNDFTQAVYQENISVLTSITGIGPKTAKRMILELKDKIGSLNFIDTAHFSIDSENESRLDINPELLKKSRQALEALGYNAREIKNCFNNISVSKDDSLEEIVQKALAYFYK